MNHCIIRSFAASALCLVLVAGSAWAGDGPAANYYAASGTYAPPPVSGSAHYAWADVLRVDPVYETVPVTRSRRECHDVRVTRQTRGDGGAGAVIGAIVGGVLGSTVGNGDGRTAATVAGAVAGGAIGHGVASSDDDSQSYIRTRCRDMPEVTHERRIGSYKVEYRYHGDVYMSHLAYDPGERLRVRVSVTPVD